MINRIVLTALIAGTLAALLLSIMQIFWVTPLILQAEGYEISMPLNTASHSVSETAWEPEGSWLRTMYTVGSNLIMAIGFALILTGLYNFRTPDLAEITLNPI